jgi:uncharacterized protein YaiE (UPF0345 family)
MALITLRNPATGEQVLVDEAVLTAPEDAPEDWASPYEGWDKIGDGLPIADLQAEAWGRVKAIRGARLQLAETTFGTAQADLESMVKINGLVSMAMLAEQSSSAFAETFTMADNSEVELDAGQMLSFGVQVGQHIAAVHARGRDLRAAIDAASSAADLAGIDLEVGWP